MMISIFPGVDGSSSIDRYTRELAQHFPPGFDVRLIRMERSQGFQGLLDKYWRYLQLARRQQGDWNIIASESNSYLLFALPRNRTAIICHDVHPLLLGIGGLAYRVRFWLSLLLMRRAKFVIAVSRQTREDLLRWCPFLPDSKVVVVHNGLTPRWKPIEDSRLIQRFREAHSLSGKKIVLHVGNDMPHKNVATLVRAMAHLTESDWVFFKVGELRLPTLQLIDQLDMASHLRHVSHLHDSELLLAYNAADALVFPSLSEGFGWPPLEAMACGCPVVVSQRGSLPEVCEEAALLVPPLDEVKMADAIRRVVSDRPLRAMLITKGLAQAAKYDWALTCARILDLCTDPVPSHG